MRADSGVLSAIHTPASRTLTIFFNASFAHLRNDREGAGTRLR